MSWHYVRCNGTIGHLEGGGSLFDAHHAQSLHIAELDVDLNIFGGRLATPGYTACSSREAMWTF